MGAVHRSVPVLEAVRADEWGARWLAELERPEVARVAAGLPEAGELPEILLDLAVPHESVNELVALRRRFDREPQWRWLLDRALSGLLHRPDEPGAAIGPGTPPVDDPLGRCFPVFVYLAALPHALAHHRRHGIDPEVSRRTLADLGRQIALHRGRHGRTGLSTPFWPALHFRGELYQLGRLQFQRTVLTEKLAPLVTAAGAAPRPDAPALDLHIPDFLGPLSPDAVERSLELARAFFPRHYPQEDHQVAMCASWLLDPQLRAYLPADSNIVAFQRRFRPGPIDPEPDDAGPIRFVFGDVAPLSELPRRTAMERAIVDHLRSGRHWHFGRGWFPLRDDSGSRPG